VLREKSCGVVVFRRNGETEYLLLHYESGHWDYAKGQVEAGESEGETAVRELQEETGLTAHFVDGFREEINYVYQWQGKTVYKTVVFFLAEAKSGEVKLSYEHKGYTWLSYEKAMAQLTFDNAKNLLKKAHKFLQGQKISPSG
jgi:bis(5'-nucleosidyl)-tetraphosphatase